MLAVGERGDMLRFIIEFVVFFVIMAASTLPLKRVSTLVQRRFSFKAWLRGAGLVAFTTALLGWSSRDLQRGCLAERNDGCIDFGGAGTQFLLVGGFVAFALISAYLKYND